LAVELGVPVRRPELLARVRQALAAMSEAAAKEDRAQLVKTGYEFHLSLVGLADHRRLEESYRSLWLLMHLYMAGNRRAREENNESLGEHVERHRKLLSAVETGNPATVLAALADHGDRTLMDELTRELAEGPKVGTGG
jgi:DNA-binding GntR family transcriptional regulator